MNGDIIVVGDTHGDFSEMNTMINKNQPSIVLHTGDFGFWPKLVLKGKWDKPSIPKIVSGKIYWCDGNHEDHWTLIEKCKGKREPLELHPNTFYMPRGSTLTLPDGRVVMFIGGAYSIDKEYRTIGRDWFPDEVIKQSDVVNIPTDTKVDIVISHTAPNEFPIKGALNIDSYGKFTDSSRTALSYILETFKPKLWYFGHWHRYQEGFNCGCKWIALNHSGSSDIWWRLLQ